jgi:hypothetical protein
MNVNHEEVRPRALKIMRCQLRVSKIMHIYAVLKFGRLFFSF